MVFVLLTADRPCHQRRLRWHGWRLSGNSVGGAHGVAVPTTADAPGTVSASSRSGPCRRVASTAARRYRGTWVARPRTDRRHAEGPWTHNWRRARGARIRAKPTRRLRAGRSQSSSVPTPRARGCRHRTQALPCDGRIADWLSDEDSNLEIAG